MLNLVTVSRAKACLAQEERRPAVDEGKVSGSEAQYSGSESGLQENTPNSSFLRYLAGRGKPA
jgi:hypothetical protein